MKQIVSLFFSLTFVLLITAPTIITAVENSFDVSVLIDINEEENKENEKNKNLEIDVFETNRMADSFSISLKNKALEYYSKTQATLYLKLHSPPPEQSIL